MMLVFVSIQISVHAQTNTLRIYWIPVQGGESGDFFITATEITFDQFDEFCVATGHPKPEDASGRGQQPVVNVTHADALAYCKWLSSKTSSIIKLPSQDEWKYAANGGKKSGHFVFSGSGNPKEVAWFSENSEEDEYIVDKELPEARVHIVATKQPNELGIYDMSGNVWEWSDSPEVAMGGAYNSVGQDCFPYATKQGINDNYKAMNLGFRVMMKK